MSELLQLESESKKTMDHLEDVIDADMKVEESSLKIMKSIVKLKEVREDLKLLYLSKTVN